MNANPSPRHFATRAAIELHGAEVAFRCEARDRGENMGFAEHDLAKLQLIASKIAIFAQELAPQIEALDMARADVVRGAFTKVRKSTVDVLAIAEGFVSSMEDELSAEAGSVLMAAVVAELA